MVWGPRTGRPGVRRAGGVLALAGLLAVGAGGCFTRFIMRGDVIRSADGWTITLSALKDGPNSVQTAGDGTYAVPPRGSRFLWAWIDVRNDVGARRTFGYDTCDMDLGDTAVLPSIIGRFPSESADHRSDDYNAGEEISVHLIFSYPKGLFPTRIRCGNTVFAVPPQPRKAAKP